MRTDIKCVSFLDLDILADWHEDHVTINFPDSKYKRRVFLDSIKKAFARMHSNRKKEGIFKILVKEEMVGWLWLKIIFDVFKDYYYCDLHYIHLLPEYRGKGLGKKLMKKADEWAKKNRAKEIRLGTAADNQASINLYTECGYKTKRVLMEKKYAN